ncbi:MAG TPA: TIGR03809 family protein [Bradyrhizobium sp.]|uniref:TIGR03809 family protein n=1 Tax=Bradyrhizobium sp. TaxID=376 RepID=UPI002D7F00F4|nr:TIGR03809 family protein [Bradyrhizobium sp.]HET7889132.1 TIGR03809 family protein [Bradyrhizobium sp.]
MASQLDVAKGREIVARWCNLAEKRLEYLTELYDSGRWRRFHSEEAFLENIREAKTAVETWRELVSCEARRDNTPVDLSWLGRARTAIPRNELRRGPVALPKIADVPIAPPEPAATVAEENVVVGREPLAEPLAEDAWASVLDLATVAARYPILRNTL